MSTMGNHNRLIWLMAVVLAASACKQAGNTKTAEPQNTDRERAELPVLVTLPSFALTDQMGERFGADQLSGKTWIGNFIFTRCGATCPTQTANLAKLQQRLEKLPGWDNVHLISFTVDPDYDTWEVLAAYAKLAQADPEHWHFLTGSREEIWSLCKKGFKLAVADAPPEASTPIMHSANFVLVDGQGRVRGFFDGTTEDGVTAIFAGLQQLLEHDETNKPSS